MKKDRAILHCDMNNFYASVECVLDPSLRGKPIAVCGSEKERHGIVMARNYEAKAYGVLTAEPVWQAKKKCKDLIVVDNPHFEMYSYYSEKAKDIYKRFTDYIEPMGLDECWLDVTNSILLFGEPKKIADTIRNTIKKELGLTISVGVSFNKTFAKLGSDLKKPDATTVISRDEFKKIVWPLPISDIIGVGRKTAKLLNKNFIYTMEDVAKSKPERLEQLLGVNGIYLYNVANGIDDDPVAKYDEMEEVKSISHGITTVSDMKNNDEVWDTILMLTQEIAYKLRSKKLRAGGISVAIRLSDLSWQQYRKKLKSTEESAINIAKLAFSLFKERYDWSMPVRNVTVGVMYLSSDDEPEQLSIFDNLENKERIEKAERTMEKLNLKYGGEIVTTASLLKQDNVPSRRRKIKYNEEKD